MLQSLQFTGRKLLIVLAVLIGTLIVGILFLFILIYHDVTAEQKDYVDIASQLAIEQTPMENAQTVYMFNGQKTYRVVIGEDGDGETLFVFIPKDEAEEIEWIHESEGINRVEMLASWKNDCPDCHLKQVGPGLVNGNYVWEIIYETNERMYFQNYRFSNGELYDSISFSK